MITYIINKYYIHHYNIYEIGGRGIKYNSTTITEKVQQC